MILQRRKLLLGMAGIITASSRKLIVDTHKIN